MTEQSLLKSLRENPFVLAPMAGITDNAFRSFMREQGSSIVITELVSANGLKYSAEKTRKIMRFEDAQRPVGIQIFGEDLPTLGEAAKHVEDTGADFVDLNFGCPVPKVVKKGAGSAVLKDLVQLRKVLRCVKSSVQIPVTIKIRTGWNELTKNSELVSQIAYDEGITWVAIHGRTRSAGYSGKADWDYIRDVKKNSPLPILGNGDITSAVLANKRMSESLCDGVMIGRGCLKNPWIFMESRDLENGLDKNLFGALKKLKKHLEQKCDERIVSIQLKKFSSWYSSGYPKSSLFRKEIFSTKSSEDAWKKIEDYFSSMTNDLKKDTSSEAFLMGGHG